MEKQKELVIRLTCWVIRLLLTETDIPPHERAYFEAVVKTIDSVPTKIWSNGEAI